MVFEYDRQFEAPFAVPLPEARALAGPGLLVQTRYVLVPPAVLQAGNAAVKITHSESQQETWFGVDLEAVTG